ncbi:MAG: type II toxin-antitoxin system VapC family toxin [Candidatus Methylomirabilis oxygeniifera]|uniref:PilT protein-like n=1 Tax=Methylomirabilis oxygeniifera TaxID=671143 RepID=D5MGM9_METO1|nr:MAG: type II toxin-antitoxin system VapC family toxin [Candidatus Methylomirabilis oxyfera]CBE68910.1 PilT protein-like [Candidatus Methylomirabilis oxyfera]
MILVDTSVWIEQLRRGSERLQSLLYDEQVLCHPFIIGELACGTLRNRQEILRLLSVLPQVLVADHEEVVHLVEGRHLYGRGLGWVDVHLLASSILTRCTLWTLDKRLRQVAAALKISM